MATSNRGASTDGVEAEASWRSAPPAVRRRAWLARALAGVVVGQVAAGRADPPAASAVAADLSAVPLAVSAGVNAPFVEALLQELAQALPLPWSVIRVPFTRVVRMAEQGEALGFGVSPRPDREARLVFTDSLFSSTVWALSRASAPQPASRVADLTGLDVCVARDASLGEAIDAAAGREFRLRVANGDFASRLRMLAAGRCEVVLATHYSDDPALLQRRVRAAGVDEAQVVLAPQPLARLDVHMAARRDSPLAVWVPAVNRALAERQAAIRRLLQVGA